MRVSLGLCSYYLKFVNNFSDIDAPLCELTKKNQPFVWVTRQQSAFEELKGRLTTAPIFELPSDDCEYILDCDASNLALGAVLSKMQDGDERVVAYGSTLLSNAEKNYCVTRKELLAVVYFIRYYKQ